MSYTEEQQNFLTLYNLLVHSPYVNRRELDAELLRQFDLDPDKFLSAPQVNPLAGLPGYPVTGGLGAVGSLKSQEQDGIRELTAQEREQIREYNDALDREKREAEPSVKAQQEAEYVRTPDARQRFLTEMNLSLESKRQERVVEEALTRVAARFGVLSGGAAFRLWDSHGVPLDVIEKVAAERGMTVDREGYERVVKTQRKNTRKRLDD